MQTGDTIDEITTAPKPALTPERLREFPGLADLTDEKAKAIIADLTAFSQVLYHLKAVS
jgi:hypothetical protein